MKFESKFALGEVVEAEIRTGAGTLVSAPVLKIVAVTFELSGTVNYMCRTCDNAMIPFMECELTGGPSDD